MPRPRNQEERIKDAMDGKRPLGAKEKRKLGKESSSSTMSFVEFVKRLNPAQKRGLYNALVDQMDDDEYRDDEDEED